MILLSLDMAGQSGWARWNQKSDRVVFGTINLPKDSEGLLFATFADWLRFKIKADEITHVIHEAIFISKDRLDIIAIRRLYGMRARLLELCHRHNINRHEATVGAWRSEFIGCTAAPKNVQGSDRRPWLKQAAVNKCRELGHDVKNDDEAEAIGLLHFERVRLFPEYAIETTPLFANA